jgi:hypothetical protein
VEKKKNLINNVSYRIIIIDLFNWILEENYWWKKSSYPTRDNRTKSIIKNWE